LRQPAAERLTSQHVLMTSRAPAVTLLRVRSIYICFDDFTPRVTSPHVLATSHAPAISWRHMMTSQALAVTWHWLFF